MTAVRRPRSAALFVGSTSGTSAKRPERRPELQEVPGERPHMPLAFAGRAPLEQRPHLRSDLFDPLLEGGAVAVVLELLPGVEDLPG